MRIAFMGTPDYSVKTLEMLIQSEHEVVAVFAQPDKPVGRKQILTPPPVKQCAVEHNIPVYQPKNARDGEMLGILNELNPDVIVVVAYGKILPKEILTLPKYGCVNGHASLLPRHRGASPIQWAIVCGDKQTGVTTMLMDEGMDTGDILMTAVTDIGDTETAEQLFERLSVLSAELMIKTLAALEKGDITPKKQPEEGVTYAPILKKDMARIDFSKTADEICCAVRGYNSWPCAFFFLDSKRIKVLSCVKDKNTSAECGTFIGNGSQAIIACGGGESVRLIEIQPEGSKVMTAENWLRGHKIENGTRVD